MSGGLVGRGAGGGVGEFNLWKVTHEASGEQESTSNSWVHKCQVPDELCAVSDVFSQAFRVKCSEPHDISLAKLNPGFSQN